MSDAPGLLTTIARDLQVDASMRPGWVRGADRLPSPGEEVYCAEGPAEVVRVLGRTGSDGRLLELRVADGRKGFYFAAAANVLVAPPANA